MAISDFARYFYCSEKHCVLFIIIIKCQQYLLKGINVCLIGKVFPGLKIFAYDIIKSMSCHVIYVWKPLCMHTELMLLTSDDPILFVCTVP